MKRFFLYGLIGLAIVGTVAFAFRQEVLSYMITPGNEFAAYTPPPAPDYADALAWAALPDRSDPADAVPLDAGAVDLQATASFDVFYAHPTTNYGRDGWNAALDNTGVNNITDNGTIKRQASAFNGCCRIYAPRYRQATLAAFFDEAGNGELALELAYADVKAAFEYYLENYNDGRPFILAGHSQGTRHGIRLLNEVIGASAVSERLIAAYLIGFQEGLRRDSAIVTRFGLCEDAAQTGCIVSWNTMLEGGDPPKAHAPFRADRSNAPVACVNPLSWRADEAKAGADLHRGAIPFERDPAAPLETHARLISAQCKDGFLFVSEPGKRFRLLRFPGGNMHNYDYALFYMNIRENAVTRAAAFSAQ